MIAMKGGVESKLVRLAAGNASLYRYLPAADLTGLGIGNILVNTPYVCSANVSPGAAVMPTAYFKGEYTDVYERQLD
jgi:hypothetical protein